MFVLIAQRNLWFSLIEVLLKNVGRERQSSAGSHQCVLRLRPPRRRALQFPSARGSFMLFGSQ